MTAYTHTPAEQAHARAHQRRQVSHLEYPKGDPRGVKAVLGIVDAAARLRGREDGTCTGLHSPVLTLTFCERMQRERRRGFVAHAMRHGATVREALAWVRVLRSPFAEVFDVTEAQACRWLRALENRHTRRMRREERAA